LENQKVQELKINKYK